MNVNLEYYLYERKFDVKKLQDLIYDKLVNYCTFYTYFKTTVDIKFLKGEVRDICFVDVVINGNTELQIRIQ